MKDKEHHPFQSSPPSFQPHFLLFSSERNHLNALNPSAWGTSSAAFPRLRAQSCFPR